MAPELAQYMKFTVLAQAELQMYSKFSNRLRKDQIEYGAYITKSNICQRKHIYYLY